MVTMIPEEIIDQVRNSLQIVDVIGQYVQLRKSGRSFMGLCPFHSEKTPSFSVVEEKQIFHCFGCGAGGNVIGFTMRIEGLSFPEAVQYLADKAGIEMPHSQSQDPEKQQEANQPRQTMYQAYDLVAKLYHHVLHETNYGLEPREYITSREIQQVTAQEFQLGFAPDSWDFITAFLQKRGFDTELMQQSGILAKREYDSKPYDLFRNRLMIPISDAQGRVVAFGGRLLGEGQPKYLNSPESPLFNKSNILYNLHRARQEMRKKKQAVLFEGYMDVITAWQAGVTNGIASLGTSLTENQAKIIRRNTESVLICYDSDRAGIEAAMKASGVLISAGCNVRIAHLEDGLDPDDFIKKYGAEQFQDKLEQSLSITSFKMEYLKRQYDVTDENQRMQFISRILEQIASLPNAVERDHYLRVLAEDYNYSLEALKQEQRKALYRQKKANGRDKLSRKWNNSIDNSRYMPVKSLMPAHHNAERKLIALMLLDRKWADEIASKVGGNFNVDEYAALAAHLYNYYAMGNQADPGKFISGIDDEKLIEKATELAVEEMNVDITSRELSDYINQIVNYPIWKEIEALKEQQKQMEKQGKVIEAAQLGVQMLRLRKSLKPVSAPT
jgi:DNA primase